MPDISMCDGGGCLVKEQCRRFYLKPSERQTYFMQPPYKIKGIIFECDHYWDRQGNTMIIDKVSNLAPAPR